MAYTSPEIVRQHLLGLSTPALTIENVPVVLTGEEPAALPHHGLVDKSETVKWSAVIEPVVDGPLLLQGTAWVALAHRPLVAASEVVTLSECLETVHVPERDYQLDAALGVIRRVEGGQIPDGRDVFVYYHYFDLFERDADYTLDAAAGLLRRTGTSAIPDGAHVLVDYTIGAGSVTDDLICQAILEAHDRIVRALAPGYSGLSTDQGLQTGETELVLAILARDLAADALGLRTGSDAAGRAREWLSLFSQHETHAWQILRPFLDPYVLHSPEKRNAAQ